MGNGTSSSSSGQQSKQQRENILPEWMIPLPLSCLADLLSPSAVDAFHIQERAGRQLLEWESGPTAKGHIRDQDIKTGLQVLLSLWSFHASSKCDKKHDLDWPLSLWNEVGLAAM